MWNSATDTASFVKTDAVGLDTYTVTLYSRANGWVDAATGGLLSGGTNYTATFTVAASNAVCLRMPCFARGPNQPLNVADNGMAGMPGNFASGLPIHISNGAGVTAVDFTLRYDPTLLNIGGVSLTSAVPASGGWGCDLQQHGAWDPPIRVDVRFGVPAIRRAGHTGRSSEACRGLLPMGPPKS